MLMIRTHTFPGSFHSLVAGYVESSETLEDTVKREVLEETGISIKNIRYVASQSWPFPFVQMIGFRAEYAGGTLQFQEEEIERGGW
ncbi:NAD(+) diphosphatase, partial [Rhizobium leguminosarum]|uniref:NAD(+) diphosphatase n=1 Tax=Rhizobium leguminosarum TaxID=384 RepID=UPI003F9AA452